MYIRALCSKALFRKFSNDLSEKVSQILSPKAITDILPMRKPTCKRK